MLIRDVFETKVEEKIDPVIKVGEHQDEKKLAAEIGSYVVTPTIEKYLDDFLDHYTDTFRKPTTEVGMWISGYFGSGKSHLAKITALLIENRKLDGIPAARRFDARVPAQADRRGSILRSLSMLPQCQSQVLAFNLNSLSDSKQTPLPKLLLSQFYIAKGYGANHLYAHVIESELDRRGKLAELHAAAERLAKKPWGDIQRNLGFYSKALYLAACEVAPDAFPSPEHVAQTLETASKGNLYNVQFLIQTILADLEERQKTTGMPCRLVLVLDESGQWIEDDQGRLAQLQALVEEAAVKGQGRIWVVVTTHGDMGSVFQNARALKGDMKKIEGRFRFKFSLTTENIELVLQDRIFRKKLAGSKEIEQVYNDNPGVLRDLGELKNSLQKLPECSVERFTDFYPFFPYHVHLIPEIVKSLRSAGGRGEQLAGSTRTLLAITQDILRAGRRAYLDCAVGDLVSFDEVYHNLSGEGEVSPDVRRELARIEETVPDATPLTRRVGEVLYLIREISYIPRTKDNIARLLVEHTTDEMAILQSRITPELDRLIHAKLVARTGDEYEFLTGERRTFEEEVSEEAANLKWQDLESGLTKFATSATLGFETVPFKAAEFPARILVDDTAATREGHVLIRVTSPLAVLAGAKITDIEDRSLLPDEQQTVFVLCDRISGFDDDLKRHLAMKAVVDRWKGDSHKSEDAHRLASERESNDLAKLSRKVQEGIRSGIKGAHVVFRGSSRMVNPKRDQTPGEALRQELASFWPSLYPKYDRVPVRIVNENRGIQDVLRGARELTTDVRELKLFDKAGQVDPRCPLLDAIRVYLSGRQSRKERTVGKDLLSEFERPPYGWDPGALRIGIAALVRSGAVKVLVNKKAYTNPADAELQNAICNSHTFVKIELVLEDTEIDPQVLTEVRTVLIQLTGIRKIDETPAALSEAFGVFGSDIVEQAKSTGVWAEPAGLPLPADFRDGIDLFQDVLGLGNPMHRVNEIHVQRDRLPGTVSVIRSTTKFVKDLGKAFIEMRDLATSVNALEHRLPAGSPVVTFLGNWRTAQDSCSVTSDAVWRGLQSTKATAGLELEKLMVSWRDEARARAESALAQLPANLAARKLPGDLLEPLAEPFRKFLDSLDQETDAVRVAALPERATQLVSVLDMAVRTEQAKRKPPAHPTKPVHRVKVAQIAATVRIENEAQWDLVRDRLDEAVKQELRNGNDVELL